MKMDKMACKTEMMNCWWICRKKANFSHTLKEYHLVTRDDIVYTKRLSTAGCQKGVKDFVWGFFLSDHPVCVCVSLECLQLLPRLWERTHSVLMDHKQKCVRARSENRVCVRMVSASWDVPAGQFGWLLSYSPLSLLIHKAAWARAQLEQLFLYNNRPLLSVCLPLFGSLIYNAHPFLLKSLPLSPPFVSLLPLSMSSSFQTYCLIITDKCFRLLELTCGIKTLLLPCL